MDGRKQKTIYIDAENIIFETLIIGDFYKSRPNITNIDKINELYDKGNVVIYWCKEYKHIPSWREYIIMQFRIWECRYSEIKFDDYKEYDILVSNKTVNVDEIV